MVELLYDDILGSGPDSGIRRAQNMAHQRNSREPDLYIIYIYIIMVCP